MAAAGPGWEAPSQGRGRRLNGQCRTVSTNELQSSFPPTHRGCAAHTASERRSQEPGSLPCGFRAPCRLLPVKPVALVHPAATIPGGPCPVAAGLPVMGRCVSNDPSPCPV